MGVITIFIACIVHFFQHFFIQKKIEAMDSLVSNGATVATSPESLSAVSQTLSNILGEPPADGKPSTLGLEVVTKVVSISEVRFSTTKCLCIGGKNLNYKVSLYRR